MDLAHEVTIQTALYTCPLNCEHCARLIGETKKKVFILTCVSSMDPCCKARHPNNTIWIKCDKEEPATAIDGEVCQRSTGLCYQGTWRCPAVTYLQVIPRTGTRTVFEMKMINVQVCVVPNRSLDYPRTDRVIWVTVGIIRTLDVVISVILHIDMPWARS